MAVTKNRSERTKPREKIDRYSQVLLYIGQNFQNNLERLEEVKKLQKDEKLATAHELNQSFQTLHFNAAANITEILKKLEQFSDVLGNFNDAVQRNNPIIIAGIEEFHHLKGQWCRLPSIVQ